MALASGCNTEDTGVKTLSPNASSRSTDRSNDSDAKWWFENSREASHLFNGTLVAEGFPRGPGVDALPFLVRALKLGDAGDVAEAP